MSGRIPRLLLAATGLLVACGPSIYRVPRLEWTPYEAREMRQQKDGVTVELGKPLVPDARNTASIPAEFWVVSPVERQ